MPYKDKEQANANSRESYLRHKEEISARRKEAWHNNSSNKRDKARAYFLAHKEERLKYNADYRKKKYLTDPSIRREEAWARLGIDMNHWSWKQYLEMLEVQHGKCLGCGGGIVATRSELEGSFTVANADHDHSTGRVRGLLCLNCNRGIGYLGDNPETLRKLANYLEAKGK